VHDAAELEVVLLGIGNWRAPLGAVLTELDTASRSVVCGSRPLESALVGTVFLILSATIESCAAMHGYISRITDSGPADRYLRSVVASDIANEVEEVLVVRNAVAHAHLWRGTFSHATQEWLVPPKLDPGFGDRRHLRVTSGGMTTARLGLNVIPTHLLRADAADGVAVLDRLIDSLSSGRSSYFAEVRSRLRFNFSGDQFELKALAEKLNRDWARP
jgi:hypothetical protein